MNKAEKYEKLIRDIKALINGEDDLITVMSTVCCEIYHEFEYFNWVGFYRRTAERTLKTGPYQGGHGCLTIDFDRGVCGKCARERTVQIENDVTKLKHHIACSSETKAEIVLPVVRDGDLIAVLDIDSVEPDVFDGTDLKYLSLIVEMI